ncbi:MAG: carbohydrate ABC transporter permease [Eubacteriales bacterium]|nr:carbohydrate ABC transporter permease [Eubacteriales bacterium]MDD3504342.1 carbohydrate ABC transporter permease [Eubacteriales bacterium]
MVEKLTPSRTVFNILNYTFMIILCVICLAPLWHVMMASISDPRALMAASGLLFKPVGEITMRGYELVLQNKQILGGYVNTIIYVVGTTLLGTALTIIGGFVLSRKTKLQVPFILIIIFTMMFNGGLIPSYMVNRTLGLINNRWAILIPGVINAFYIIIMKSSFEQLPASYEESAKLDGASPMTVMFRILLPLVKATTAVVAMFIIVQQWNSWFPASIYLTKRRDLWPLQLIMREILVQNDTARILTASDAINKADMVSNLVKYCVTIVGTLPVLCVYPFAQKYFVKGVTLGGVKG